MAPHGDQPYGEMTRRAPCYASAPTALCQLHRIVSPQPTMWDDKRAGWRGACQPLVSRQTRPSMPSIRPLPSHESTTLPNRTAEARALARAGMLACSPARARGRLPPHEQGFLTAQAP